MLSPQVTWAGLSLEICGRSSLLLNMATLIHSSPALLPGEVSDSPFSLSLLFIYELTALICNKNYTTSISRLRLSNNVDLFCTKLLVIE